jgi:hypothetical protein
MRIEREEVGWTAMQIGEVTPTPTTNPNFFTQDFSVIKYQYLFTQLTSYASTKKSSRTTANDDSIPSFTHDLLKALNDFVW